MSRAAALASRKGAQKVAIAAKREDHAAKLAMGLTQILKILFLSIQLAVILNFDNFDLQFNDLVNNIFLQVFCSTVLINKN